MKLETGERTKANDFVQCNKDNYNLFLWTHCKQQVVNQMRLHRKFHEEPLPKLHLSRRRKQHPGGRGAEFIKHGQQGRVISLGILQLVTLSALREGKP